MAAVRGGASWNKFIKELTNIYGFKEALVVKDWDMCLQWHEPGTDFYVELIFVGSVYIVREQRGEDVQFNYYYWPDALLMRLDEIL